jgi:tetratricopeptide (TPR) repeat protein
MRALYFKSLFLLMVLTAVGLTGCVSLFYPSMPKDYDRTLQMYEAGGPYEKVIRASVKGQEKVTAFERRCPVGSACRQKNDPGDTDEVRKRYAYLEAASYYKLGQLAKAFGLAAKPEHEYYAPMRRLMGTIHFDRGDTEKAAREYFYLLLLGDQEGAAKLLPPLEASLEGKTLNYQTPHLLNLRAARCERSNDTQGALRDYAASISAEPRQTHGYLRRAMIYSDGGMPDKALAELNTAMFIDSRKKTYGDSGMDALEIAELYFQRGRLRLATSNADGALADFATAGRKSKDPRQVARVNFEIGQIHEDMGKFDQAIIYYKKAADMPGFGDPWYRMAICYAQQSMAKESKEALVALARIDREKSDALLQSLKEMELLE